MGGARPRWAAPGLGMGHRARPNPTTPRPSEPKMQVWFTPVRNSAGGRSKVFVPRGDRPGGCRARGTRTLPRPSDGVLAPEQTRRARRPNEPERPAPERTRDPAPERTQARAPRTNPAGPAAAGRQSPPPVRRAWWCAKRDRPIRAGDGREPADDRIVKEHPHIIANSGPCVPPVRGQNPGRIPSRATRPSLISEQEAIRSMKLDRRSELKLADFPQQCGCRTFLRVI